MQKKFKFARPLRVIVAVTCALVLGACATRPTAPIAPAYFLSIQDGRAGLSDGTSVVRNEKDSLAVIELSGGRLRVAQEIEIPTSLVGPPSSIAIAPNGRCLLYTSDAADE